MLPNIIKQHDLHYKILNPIKFVNLTDVLLVEHTNRSRESNMHQLSTAFKYNTAAISNMKFYYFILSASLSNRTASINF
jgi:hypothetical protein